jgi:UDPglucose 6-dehydrogenase
VTGQLRIGVVGAGYVGLTSAVCMAARGLNTVVVDIDADKVRRLCAGESVIDEPDVPELLRDGRYRGLLTFTTDFDALGDRDLVFICVPTPSRADGQADLTAVFATVAGLRRVLRSGSIVAVKSTVPVGTAARISDMLSDTGIRVVSTPEFLREGHAVHDFRAPDRVVIGTHDDAAAQAVRRAYGVHPKTVQQMRPESAELAKYASNAFLAVKLSYANSLAALCARVDADVDEVTGCMGADARIGPEFLRPGPGWGGSCLPKDTAALVHTAQQHGVSFAEVDAARKTNAAQADRITTTLHRALGRSLSGLRITALGLTFKAHTSDTRDSPALRACAHLAAAGAEVTCHDPCLDRIDPAVVQHIRAIAVDDPYRAAKSADAIVLLTEWPQYQTLDWRSIARDAPTAVVLDTRNLLDSAAVADVGLTYIGNGRPAARFDGRVKG